MQKIIQQLKNYMEEKRITQRELAEVLETNESQVNRWLREKHEVSKSWEFVIKAKLGI